MATKVGSLFVELTMKGKQFSNTANNAKKQLMSIKGAALLAAGAMSILAKKVFDSGAAFEYSTKVIKAYTNVSTKEFKKLEGIIRSLGATTEFTAVEVSNAAKVMAVAGMTMNQIMKAIPATTQLATAGLLDLSSAADISVSTMRSFALEAKDLARVNDVILTLVTKSNITLEKFATTLKYAGAMAHTYGYSVQELAVYTGVLADANIRACYDEETEVLTENGWKRWGNVTEKDILATVNPDDNHKIEYYKPKKLFSYEHDGKMYKVENKHIDLLVTPNHKLYTSADSISYELNRADKVYGNGVFHFNPLINKDVAVSVDDEEWVQYKGMVYCAEMPKNHILIVKRKGKVIACGNSLAGTQLSMAFQRNSRALKELGKKPGSLPLIETIRLIEKAGWSADKVMQVFSQRAGRAVLAIMKNKKRFDELSEAMDNTRDATTRIAKEIRSSLSVRMKVLGSVITDKLITAFNALQPTFSATIEGAIGLVNILGSLVAILKPALIPAVYVLNVVFSALKIIIMGAATALEFFAKMVKLASTTNPSNIVQFAQKMYGAYKDLGSSIKTIFKTIKKDAKNIDESLATMAKGADSSVDTVKKSLDLISKGEMAIGGSPFEGWTDDSKEFIQSFTSAQDAAETMMSQFGMTTVEKELDDVSRKWDKLIDKWTAAGENQLVEQLKEAKEYAIFEIENEHAKNLAESIKTAGDAAETMIRQMDMSDNEKEIDNIKQKWKALAVEAKKLGKIDLFNNINSAKAIEVAEKEKEQIKERADALKKLNDELSKLSTQAGMSTFEKQIDNSARGFEKWKNEAKELIKDTTKLATKLKEINKLQADAKKDLEDKEKTRKGDILQKIKDSANEIISGSGLTDHMKKVISITQKWEVEMRKVVKLFGEGSKEVKEMEAQIKKARDIELFEAKKDALKETKNDLTDIIRKQRESKELWEQSFKDVGDAFQDIKSKFEEGDIMGGIFDSWKMLNDADSPLKILMGGVDDARYNAQKSPWEAYMLKEEDLQQQQEMANRLKAIIASVGKGGDGLSTEVAKVNADASDINSILNSGGEKGSGVQKGFLTSAIGGVADFVKSTKVEKGQEIVPGTEGITESVMSRYGVGSTGDATVAKFSKLASMGNYFTGGGDIADGGLFGKVGNLFSTGEGGIFNSFKGVGGEFGKNGFGAGLQSIFTGTGAGGVEGAGVGGGALGGLSGMALGAFNLAAGSGLLGGGGSKEAEKAAEEKASAVAGSSPLEAINIGNVLLQAILDVLKEAKGINGENPLQNVPEEIPEKIQQYLGSKSGDGSDFQSLYGADISTQVADVGGDFASQLASGKIPTGLNAGAGAGATASTGTSTGGGGFWGNLFSGAGQLGTGALKMFSGAKAGGGGLAGLLSGKGNTNMKALSSKAGAGSSALSALTKSGMGGKAAGVGGMGGAAGAIGMGGQMVGGMVGGKAGGAISGAAQGAQMGAVAGPMGMAAGAVIGGTLGAMKGKKKSAADKAKEKKERAEKSAFSKDMNRLAYSGMMTASYSKEGLEGAGSGTGQVLGEAGAKEYLRRLKELAQSIQQTVSQAISAGIEAQTVSSSIEEFSKAFGEAFEKPMIKMAEQSMTKIAEQIVNPFYQIVNDIATYLELAFYNVTEPLREGISNAYIKGMEIAEKHIVRAWNKVFDVVEDKLGSTLASGIEGMLIMAVFALIPALEMMLAGVLGTIGRATTKMLEPMMKAVFYVTRAMDKVFDTQEDWIKEMERAGMELSKDMGTKTVEAMKSAWGEISGIISGALEEAFNSFTASSGMHNFERALKEGIYEWVTKAVAKAMAASVILMAELGPYLVDFIKLLTKAVITGTFDSKELEKILKGITKEIDNTLDANEGVITEFSDIIQDWKNDLLGMGNPTGPDFHTTDPFGSSNAETRDNSSDENADSFLAGLWKLFSGEEGMMGGLFDNVGEGTLWESITTGFTTWLKDRPKFGQQLAAAFTTWLKDRPKFGQQLAAAFTTWLDIRPKYGQLFVNAFMLWLKEGKEKFINWAYIFWATYKDWLDKKPDFDALFSGAWISWLGEKPSFGKWFKEALIEWWTNRQLENTGINDSASNDGRSGSIGGVIPYASGTDYVPSTGLALLHKGEAVITAEENEAGVGRGVVINITNPVFNNMGDVDELMETIGDKLNEQLRMVV